MSLPIVSIYNWWSKSYQWLKDEATLRQVSRELAKLTNQQLETLTSEILPKDVPRAIKEQAIKYIVIYKHISYFHSFIAYYLDLDKPKHYIKGQYDKYLKFRKTVGGRVVNTPECFKAKYGPYYEYYINRYNNQKNPYDIEATAKRHNISEKQAINLVNKHKKSTAGTLENFIARYGEIEGTKRFKKFCLKSAHTEDKFKKRYGSKWKEKWDTYCASKDSISLSACIKRYGKIEGTRVHSQRIKDSSVTLKTFIKKYGKVRGPKLYSDYIIVKTNHWSMGQATHQSMDFFKPIITYLRHIGLEYWVGQGRKKEYFLYCDERNCIRFYDFYIPRLKLMIEFDGETHPSPLLNEKELKSWRCFITGISAQARLAEDEHKSQLAKKHGMIFRRIHVDQFKQNPEKWILKAIKLIDKLRLNYEN